MGTFVALLRAVNVGGTGKLPMGDLKRVCEAAGFTAVRTLLASGNVVFDSRGAEKSIQAKLRARLAAHLGNPIDVMIRTSAEMLAVWQANPFQKLPPNSTVAIFLDTPPPEDALERIAGRTVEQIALGKREIYVHYGASMGQTKLRIAAAKTGTARNMNTIAKLAAMAAQRSSGS